MQTRLEQLCSGVLTGEVPTREFQRRLPPVAEEALLALEKPTERLKQLLRSADDELELILYTLPQADQQKAAGSLAKNILDAIES